MSQVSGEATVRFVQIKIKNYKGYSEWEVLCGTRFAESTVKMFEGALQLLSYFSVLYTFLMFSCVTVTLLA